MSHTVCSKQSCSAPSGQICMVFVYGFVFLLSGVYAAMRSSEMWSDCMGIISTTLRACHHAEQILGWPFKFTLSSPLWNNPCLMSGGQPFTSTTWSSSKGIHMMLVIMAPDAHSKTFKFNIHYQAHLTFFLSSAEIGNAGMWSTVESMIPSHPYPFILALMTVPRAVSQSYTALW